MSSYDRIVTASAAPRDTNAKALLSSELAEQLLKEQRSMTGKRAFIKESYFCYHNLERPVKFLGAELRKLAHTESKNKKAAAGSKTKDKVSSSSGISCKTVRFTLGNGMSALTSETLLGLVKSTSPFHFPQMYREVIHEDDDDFYLLGESTVEDDKIDQSVPQEQLSEGFAKLCDLVAFRDGWKSILLADKSHPPPSESPSPQARIDYFALCLAAHFSSVATYVPTDVDSKIRSHVWDDSDKHVLISQFEILKSAYKNWVADDVSQRTLVCDDTGRLISGHDGEFIGVFAGAMCKLSKMGENELAKEAENIIEYELER